MKRAEEFQYYSLSEFKIGLPIIFVDFDYTISNFGEMKKSIKSSCKEIGIDEIIWDESYKKFKNSLGIYNSFEHEKYLAEKYPNIETEISDIYKAVYQNASKFKYDDVDIFLSKYSKDYNIILFTLGNEDFQLIKRKSSDIDKFLVGSINTNTSKENAVKEIVQNSYFGIVNEIIFVDDRADYFEKYKNILDNSSPKLMYRFVWINRPNSKYSNLFPSDRVKDDLTIVDDLSILNL
jgi:hypothetical protein